MALPPHATPFERAWRGAYLAICVAVLAFLIAPIIVIIPLSFNAEPWFTFTPAMRSLDPEGFSLRWYDSLLTFGMAQPDAARDAGWWADVWQNARWVQAAKNSFIIGIGSTVIATVLGTLAALGLARPEMPARRAIMALLISPMIVPLIITATGMFFFYSAPCAPLGWIGLEPACGRLAGTHAGVILAHATLGVPFVVITVTATLAGFDRALIRAAASLGASPWVTFYRVVLPLILPGVVSGALLAFVTSFDEVVTVLFLAGPEQQTLPRQMWSGIREQVSPAILAVATLLVFLSVALLTVVELLRRRGERLRGRAGG